MDEEMTDLLGFLEGSGATRPRSPHFCYWHYCFLLLSILLLTLLFSVVVYMVTNVAVIIIFVVSVRVWRYGSQLFHHHFFATYHFVRFFILKRDNFHLFFEKKFTYHNQFLKKNVNTLEGWMLCNFPEHPK